MRQLKIFEKFDFFQIPFVASGIGLGDHLQYGYSSTPGDPQRQKDFRKSKVTS